MYVRGGEECVCGKRAGRGTLRYDFALLTHMSIAGLSFT